ncbi:MAG: hypothetical protein KGI78_01685 [Patescibacteria group bacterium]|nr:hypothetical protein [Patescibacteria group bacterium]MDE1943868.1 hypothetical protein [Patescibacteria group bacterium]MDE2057546.1 hypothetical protein [Patescibacteria group bacterium]
MALHEPTNLLIGPVEIVSCCADCRARLELRCDLVHRAGQRAARMICVRNSRRQEAEEPPVIGVCTDCLAGDLCGWQGRRGVRLLRNVEHYGVLKLQLVTAMRFGGGLIMRMGTDERILYGLILTSRLRGLTPEVYLAGVAERLAAARARVQTD